MKRTIKFKDLEKSLVIAKCTITERNGYPEFTMSGQYKNGSGQVFDNIKPANDKQKELIDIWHNYHLNGMNAGAQEQTGLLNELYNTLDKEQLITLAISGHKNKLAIKEMNDISIKDYSFKVALLNAKNKLTVKHPTTGKPYKYGSGWITKDLPEDFENDLDTLLDEIEEIEEENKEREVTEEDSELFEDFDNPELCLALALIFDLSINEIEEIEENGDNIFTIQGTSYLAGDDDDMNTEWEEYLENYLDECVLPELNESYHNYFDRDKWIEDAKIDGRGHSLNSYDGGEEELNVNGTYYYAYRN